jgi:DNA repair protein RecO (recombination protein O)
MLQKINGIVIHIIKYNDSFNIADIFTREKGRASFLVRIPKSRKAGVRNNLFQPLSMIELEADFRDNKHIFRVKNAKLYMPFISIPYDPYKVAIALFISEFLNRALREEIHDQLLYSYIENSIKWFDECRTNFANFHLVFLLRMSRFLGLYPNMEDYEDGSYFDMVNSCFTPGQPISGAFIGPEDASHIRMLFRMNYETMHLFAMNREQRNRCLNIINDYYRLHIPDFPVLKSMDVLKEVFS